MVQEFHEAFQLPQGVGMRDNENLKLRLKLLAEEFTETVEAAGDLFKANESVQMYPELIRSTLQQRQAAEHLLKELIDLQYIVVGVFDSFGVDMDEAFRRVHASNMSKLGDDDKPVYRDDGKVMKGPNYTPPTLTDLV
jgi:predicted HAD superfamily Cof-like phosphohydrolase